MLIAQSFNYKTARKWVDLIGTNEDMFKLNYFIHNPSERFIINANQKATPRLQSGSIRFIRLYDWSFIKNVIFTPCIQ